MNLKKNLLSVFLIILLGFSIILISCEEEVDTSAITPPLQGSGENATAQLTRQDLQNYHLQVVEQINQLEERVEELEDESSFSGWIFFTWILLAGGLVAVYFLTKNKSNP